MPKQSPLGSKLPPILEEKHKSHVPDRWPAARLEGRVQNMGLKNLGKQARKGKRGDR